MAKQYESVVCWLDFSDSTQELVGMMHIHLFTKELKLLGILSLKLLGGKLAPNLVYCALNKKLLNFSENSTLDYLLIP